MGRFFRLKEFRNANGLNQIEMASILGCTQGNISRIENQMADLEEKQYAILYEKYTRATIDSFIGNTDERVINIHKNTIEGDGNNGNALGGTLYSGFSKDALDIINRLQNQIESLTEQNKTLTELVAKLTSKMTFG